MMETADQCFNCRLTRSPNVGDCLICDRVSPAAEYQVEFFSGVWAGVCKPCMSTLDPFEIKRQLVASYCEARGISD